MLGSYGLSGVGVGDKVNDKERSLRQFKVMSLFTHQVFNDTDAF